MNLKQAEIILEKITRLYKSMKLDERNVDAFEQDLMLSYIRQLYESFSPDKPVAKKVKPVLPPVETTPVKPIVQETPKPAEPVKAKPKPKPAEPKVVEKTPDPTPPKVKEVPKVVPPPPSAPAEAVENTPKAAPKPKPSPTPPPPKKKATTSNGGLSPAERAALFEFKEATELSEKLSMAPIRDLTKAMGLNEKIFTINELFGGDSKVFDETIRTLNTFTSFEQAAEYLAQGVAYKYQWANRGKKKKAINFITLVKRRYS